jgi:hypothetical protein
MSPAWTAATQLLSRKEALEEKKMKKILRAVIDVKTRRNWQPGSPRKDGLLVKF